MRTKLKIEIPVTKPRNPVAVQLRSALCRPQVIPSVKVYKRKPRNQNSRSD